MDTASVAITSNRTIEDQYISVGALQWHRDLACAPQMQQRAAKDEQMASLRLDLTSVQLMKCVCMHCTSHVWSDRLKAVIVQHRECERLSSY